VVGEVDPKAVTPFADLYADYEAWCREQGDEPMPKRRFGDRLSEKGFPSVKIRTATHKGQAGRKGLRLKSGDEAGDEGTRGTNFQYNPIETHKLPRDIQTSSPSSPDRPDLSVTSENSPIACYHDEKVSILPSPYCREPLTPDEDSLAVCVGCGRLWWWADGEWVPIDPDGNGGGVRPDQPYEDDPHSEGFKEPILSLPPPSPDQPDAVPLPTPT
jgi:hypothetical protein